MIAAKSLKSLRPVIRSVCGWPECARLPSNKARTNFGRAAADMRSSRSVPPRVVVYQPALLSQGDLRTRRRDLDVTFLKSCDGRH